MKHTFGIKVPKEAVRSHREFHEASEADYHSLKRQAHRMHRKVRI